MPFTPLLDIEIESTASSQTILIDPLDDSHISAFPVGGIEIDLRFPGFADQDIGFPNKDIPKIRYPFVTGTGWFIFWRIELPL